MALLSLSRPVALFVLAGSVLGGCSAPPQQAAQALVLLPGHTNAIAYWHDIGAATIGAKGTSAATEAEKYGAFPADMATMHLAMYDAAMAIERRYRPYHFAPRQPAPDASVDAASATAAYEVLRALFPNRAAHYQQAYDSFMGALPDNAGKARGVALGVAAAAAHVTQRATDGRATAPAPYVEAMALGRFRGSNPVLRSWLSIRPFTLTSIAQFRPPPPPALNSAEYATDFNEVKELGGKVSTRRTVEQSETARFHAEPLLSRNLGRFARTTTDPIAAARLMAAIYANQADTMTACLDAKYHYDTWRPHTAIPLADTDNNPATMADAAWTSAFFTPNHPEYPAAHSCSAGALGQLLRHYYGTDKVTFTWDSNVTGTTRTYADTDALAEESKLARIHGGMHFRYSTTAGTELGKKVADWTMRNAFMPAQP